MNPMSAVPPVADPPAASGKWAAILLALALAAFTFGNGIVQARLTPMGIAPDEIAHLTYVQDVASGARWIPDYLHSRVLLSNGGANYLSHPPLYYTLLGGVGRVNHWQDAVAHYRAYRQVTAGLVALGIMFWVLGACNLGIARWKTVTVIAACNAVPMFSYLAGSVNNDNLAYATVALCFWGISLYPRKANWACYLTALGLLACALTKANAFAFSAVLTLFWLYATRRAANAPWRNPHLRVGFGAAALLALGYFLPTFIAYHTLFPKAGALYQNLPAPSMPLSLIALTGRFTTEMMAGLPRILSHASMTPLGDAASGLFFLMLASPLACLAASLRSWPSDAAHQLTISMAVAFSSVLLLHFFAVASTYYHHGQLAALQPRYYNFALTGILLCSVAASPQNRIAKMCMALFAASTLILLPLSISALIHAQRIRNAAPSTRIVFDAAKPTDAAAETPIESRGAGTIELLHKSGNAVTLSGWAIDTASKRATEEVKVLYRNRMLGWTTASLARADIASRLGAPAARFAGFTVTVVNLSGDPCAVALLAKQQDGRFVSLPNPTCEPER